MYRSKHDRNENIRRIAFLAKMLTRNGIVVLVSAIAPYREARDEARRSIGHFLEVYVHAELSVCELRDPKGLYRKARISSDSRVHRYRRPVRAADQRGSRM